MKKLKSVADIGIQVRHIRKEQKVSQDTLAGLAGTGARYISELERGKETARIRELLKLLDALGATAKDSGGGKAGERDYYRMDAAELAKLAESGDVAAQHTHAYRLREWRS